MKYYQHMAQREARIQWIFKHTDEYQKMRDLDPGLPHVDYEIAQRYRALIDVLVCVREYDDSDQSDQSDEEHEWYAAVVVSVRKQREITHVRIKIGYFLKIA